MARSEPPSSPDRDPHGRDPELQDPPGPEGSREDGRPARAGRLAALRERRRQVARERRVRRNAQRTPIRPHLCVVRSPAGAGDPAPLGQTVKVATYNVHRWTGLNGRRAPDPRRAAFVLSELGADVIALQEVLRPAGDEEILERIADELGLHVAFATTRMHRRGALGNAILSRWPLQTASTLDISHSRIERRSALAARFASDEVSFAVIATHLSLVDRTRHRQVRALLGHPELSSGPAVLLGDMNAWRNCKASRALDEELTAHHNLDWPASFPAARPVLSLDRVYARGARVTRIESHESEIARLASDHLPVVAHVDLVDAGDGAGADPDA